MRPTLSDGVILVYNVAVLLSAGYMTVQLDIRNRWALLGLALVFGIFWTVYFRISVLPRLLEEADVSTEADDDDANGPPEPGADGRP